VFFNALAIRSTALELAPGRVVRLYAGDRTEWRVHQTVRKLYLGPTESPAG
jgi:uncharacterized cupin superfamily protein